MTDPLRDPLPDSPPAARSGRHRPAQRHPRVWPAARLTVKVLAALLSASVLIGAGYFRNSYTSLENGLHRVSVGGLGQPAPAAHGAQPQQVDGSAQNLLIIGDDDRSGLTSAQKKQLHVGASSATTSTDTLLVVHVPANGRKATLISIPRDSYVPIPGFQRGKINAAYVDGYTYGTDGYPVSSSSSAQQRQSAGITLLIRVIKNLTGLQIDHYVLVNFLGFFNIAAAIHGVSVNLCHAVDDTPAHNRTEGLGGVGSGFQESAGPHSLTPVQSLEFVRQRHNLVDAKGNQLNDLGREARQRYFLAAAFRKIESARTLLEPGKLNALIEAIKKTLTIDDGLSLESLAHQMLDLSSGNILGQTIPTEGTQNVGSVGDVVVVDPATVQNRIRQWLAAPAPSTKPRTPTSASSPASSGAGSSPSATASASPSVPPAQKGCIN